MSALEIFLLVAILLWLMVCTFTAVLKGRGMGWAIATWLLPPLYLLLVRLRPVADEKPARVRCPLCKLGWVRIDRLPRVCNGCGKDVPLSTLQREIQKDMM